MSDYRDKVNDLEKEQFNWKGLIYAIIKVAIGFISGWFGAGI